MTILFATTKTPTIACYHISLLMAAFYDNLFEAAMMDEVREEKRWERKDCNAKKLQETIDVSTIGLNKKVGYNY